MAPHRLPHSSSWHSISPTTRPLSLSILEITSLSITLSLHLAAPPTKPTRKDHATTKHRRKHRKTESEDEMTAVEDDSYPSSLTGHGSTSHTPPYASAPAQGNYPSRLPLSPNAKPSFKELLSKGVVVTVNGQPWTRIVAHVSDDEESAQGGGTLPGGLQVPQEPEGEAREGRQDRAVVVIYGLGPGKEYEVDLRVVGNFGEEVAGVEGTSPAGSARVVTSTLQVQTPTGNRSRANSVRKNRSRSSSLIQPEATPPSTEPHLPTSHSTPTISAPAPPANPSDPPSQAAHLHHLLLLTTSEKDTLLSNLKKSRRESQRTEATLKSEIEALKKSSEKTAQPDLRNRQKSLALQEQVKQGWNGAADAEREHGEILNGMGELHGLEQGVREEWGVVRGERDHKVEERDDALEVDRKALAELEGELSALSGKLDKQVGKRDKLKKENEELRSKLEEVAAAQREVEKRNEMIRQQRMLAEEYGQPGGISGLGSMYSGERGSRPNSILGGQGVWGEYDGPWGGGGGGGGAGGGRSGQRMPLHQSSMGNLSGAADHSPSYNNPDPRSRQISSQHPPRSFFPPSQRATSGPILSSGPAAAMATQGLPRSANAPLSHLGNPIGFFPASSGTTSPGSTGTVGAAAGGSIGRSFRVVSREGHQLSAQAGTAGVVPISPLMANVTAAPFMPNSMLNQSTTSNSAPASANYNSSFDYHTTSLVPPPLQHRIYLPGNRNRSSPTSTTNPGSGSRLRDPSRRPSGDSMDGSTPAPAFPPLPSQNPSAAVAIKAPPAPSGPTLASIINRAIIPSTASSVSSGSSTVRPSESYAQRSPTTSLHDSDHGTSPNVTTSILQRPAGLGRPLSWTSQAQGKQPQSFSDALTESPTQSHTQSPGVGGGGEYPALPVSPVNPWSPTSGGNSPMSVKGPTPPGSVGGTGVGWQGRSSGGSGSKE